jgi:serine kinase of HPr protein (carbohydrate metabolism regulator)
VIVREIVSALNLDIIAGASGLDKPITGGYASDMLSCVMAGAREGNVWVTLQAHPNVIAVASLLNLACVIITEDSRLDEETVAKANEKDIALLRSHESTFTIVGKLFQLGVSRPQ